MSYRQTVDQLVSEILSIDNTPVNQQTFLPNTVIQFMDDELQNNIVPLILRAREEYFVTSYLYTVGLNGVQSIQIPNDCAAFRVRDLYLYNQNGQTNTGAYKAIRFNPDSFGNFNGVYYPLYTNGSSPRYYIENNVLKFYPTLSATYTADLRVLKQPNHLVSYVCCAGQITALGANNTVTVDNVPQGTNILPNGYGDWTLNSGVNATTVDVLQPDAPFNFRTDANTSTMTQTGGTLPLIGRQIVAVNGNQITLDAGTYKSLKVGDFLVTNETSPFIQYVPFGAYNLIKYGASMRILKAQGDLVNWSVTAELFNAALDTFLNSITPKVENMPKKIGGGNRGALLGNLGWYRGF